MSSSGSCNKSFCSNYMLLNPEDAAFADVVKILFSDDIAKRRFVDCPAGTHEPLGRRWIIFISILAQKFLQATAKPLAGFGAKVEYWLNLLNGNGGFFRLIMNSFKGKVVEPDTTSESFVSFLGNIDKRVEFDQTAIGSGDKGYYALLSVMASKASYENKKYIESVVQDHWKMDFIGFYDFWNDYQEKATTQAFIMDDKKDTIVVAFRGTEPFDADAWSSDVDLSWYEISGLGKIHGGFMKALGLLKSQGWPPQHDPNRPETAYYAIRKQLTQLLQSNEKAKFIVTGHSLGGALAVLFPAVLGLHGDTFLLDRLEGVYTFGQPRVGDAKLGEYMKQLMEKHSFECIRFVYSYDLVPRLPYDDSTLLFKHFGTCIYFNSLYRGQVVDEEPDKNYFSILWMIPKLVNACFELIRSFLIRYVKGPDYQEGGVLRMFRVMGLMVAGLPAHCTYEYVTSMRLGSPEVFLSLNSALNGNKTVKMQ